MRTHNKVQIICYRNPADPEVLLLLTNQGKKSFWQGVTGGVEDTESLPVAAVREVREELGVTISQDQLLGPLHTFFFKTSRPDQLGEECWETAYAVDLSKNQEIKISDEHSEYAWYLIPFALDLIAHDDPKIVLCELFSYLLKTKK